MMPTLVFFLIGITLLDWRTAAGETVALYSAKLRSAGLVRYS